jgi:hypothetical protein
VRSFGDMGGGQAPGTRATPQMPTPNSEPLGSLTGAPPHVRFYSTSVIPYSAVGVKGTEPTQIVPGTSPNRVVTLTAPLVMYTIYIGDSGVSPSNGLALTPGLSYDATLVGLQELFAVTDAPFYMRLQIQIAPILFAERERKLGL